jgi:hypothetical protein
MMARLARLALERPALRRMPTALWAIWLRHDGKTAKP